MNGLRFGALARLVMLCTGTLGLVLAQLVVMRVMPSRRGALPLRFHRLTCWCLGVRTRYEALRRRPAPER